MRWTRLDCACEEHLGRWRVPSEARERAREIFSEYLRNRKRAPTDLRLLAQRDGEANLTMQSSASPVSRILCVVLQLPQAHLLRQNNCSGRRLTGPSGERRHD